MPKPAAPDASGHSLMPSAPLPAATPPPSTSPTSSVTAHGGGLTVKAYRGDDCVLIAFDLDPSLCTGLAGFAIARSTDGGATWTYVRNRLTFGGAVTATSSVDAELQKPKTTDVAPIQKFRWADYPPATFTGPYTYKVEAQYFVAGKDPAKDADALETRASLTFSLALTGNPFPNFKIGFTRGYVSSQLFAERYAGVTEMRPSRAVDYDTNAKIPGATTPTTWRQMYQYLGGHARGILSDFLAQCEADGNGYDVFAYDLDEPDFLRVLARDAKAGRPIRMVLDDAPLHTKPGAMEPDSAKLLTAAGVKVVRGHFKRYAHDKCVIERDTSGNAIRVLTGSANFSVRGLYVQSNSIIAIDDPDVAKLYGEAFDAAWSDMNTFPSSEIASQWFDAIGTGIPTFAVSFAPHQAASVSLDRVAAAIRDAKSSVLFAVMELVGGGDVMQELLNLQQRPDLFSYGVTQTTTGIKFYKSQKADNGLLVPFGYLKAHVPEPFRQEWNGGMGQVIHHKFVVVDFNDAQPQVFCGSSNLAAGGEQANGYNMLAITDPAIASLYAVEAIQLVDHYEFRAVAQTATQTTPLQLQGPGATPAWWQSSFDPASIKNTERLLFAR
ncbi:MAG TPA: phospholipase D-like domain-containing protein [Candidatus Elarobacter sp.]